MVISDIIWEVLTCSIVSVRIRCQLGIALFTRVNSFKEALINMVRELKITSGSRKIVYKFLCIPMVIRYSVK